MMATLTEAVNVASRYTLYVYGHNNICFMSSHSWFCYRTRGCWCSEDTSHGPQQSNTILIFTLLEAGFGTMGGRAGARYGSGYDLVWFIVWIWVCVDPLVWCTVRCWSGFNWVCCGPRLNIVPEYGGVNPVWSSMVWIWFALVWCESCLESGVNLV